MIYSKGKSRKNFLILILGFLFVGGVVWFIMTQQRSLFKDTVLAENLLISSEWQEIEAKNMIKIKGDRQFLSVVIDKPFEKDLGKPGIKSPSGEIFNPEIKLIDKEGNQYELEYDGSLGSMRANYGYEDRLPNDRKYEKILIRSKVPIEAKKIIWTYYHAKDLK